MRRSETAAGHGAGRRVGGGGCTGAERVHRRGARVRTRVHGREGRHRCRGAGCTGAPARARCARWRGAGGCTGAEAAPGCGRARCGGAVATGCGRARGTGGRGGHRCGVGAPVHGAAGARGRTGLREVQGGHGRRGEGAGADGAAEVRAGRVHGPRGEWLRNGVLLAPEPGMGATDFTELAAWQLSHELRELVIAITDRSPTCRDFKFCRSNQGRREVPQPAIRGGLREASATATSHTSCGLRWHLWTRSETS